MSDETNRAEDSATENQENQSTDEPVATKTDEAAFDQTSGKQELTGATVNDSCPTPQPRTVSVNAQRRTRARNLRVNVAQIAHNLPHPQHPTNGEERDSGTSGAYPQFPYQANYSKGLPKIIVPGSDERSDVNPTAYQTYKNILEQARIGNFPDFPDILLGGDPADAPQQPPNCIANDPVRKQTNPQSGVAFDLEGADAFAANLLYFGTNPSGGLASLRPAPRIDGKDGDGKPQNDRENAAEMIELYWMALVRDLHFKNFKAGGKLVNPPTNWGETTGAGATLIDKAVGDLNRSVGTSGKKLWEYFDDVTPYPTKTIGGAKQVNHDTIFRGSAFGDNVGPFVSQFLLRGMTVRCDRSRAIRHLPEEGVIPHGTVTLLQRQQTVLPYVDFLRDVGSWRCVQQGSDDPTGSDPFECGEDGKKGRFIRNLRDLANWVHVDYLYQHFLNAALIMLNEPPLEMPGTLTVQRRTLDSLSAAMPMRPFALDPGLPYSPGKPDARNQTGFVTFGPIHILTLLAEVVTRALKAAWFHKWYVHRRLRPEEFGGLVHFQKPYFNAATGAFNAGGPYPCLDVLTFTSPVLNLINGRNQINDALPGGQTVAGGDTYLLPQVFPEGSPTHPAYPSGHATAAGACVTILKALFDESKRMTDPTNSTQTDPEKLPAAFIAADDGLSLRAATTGEGQTVLTVEGELNKMASNIAVGRDAAGVHWRSDMTEGMKLGEAVAAQLLLEQSFTFHEDHEFSFNTLFSSKRVRYKRERVFENNRWVNRVTTYIGNVVRSERDNAPAFDVEGEAKVFDENFPLDEA